MFGTGTALFGWIVTNSIVLDMGSTLKAETLDLQGFPWCGKQDYILNRLLNRDVVVQGNPRVYKALRDQLAAVLAELQRIEAVENISDELTDIIRMIAVILGGMKEERK